MIIALKQSVNYYKNIQVANQFQIANKGNILM